LRVPRLYRKLLLDFGANYGGGGVAGDIRAALAAKNFTQAHSLVHNLKGLAGNLAATDLQAAAVAMERLVKGQAAEAVSDKELNQKFAIIFEFPKSSDSDVSMESVRKIWYKKGVFET
jgi:chemotaxis protein histidine kinase CheA